MCLSTANSDYRAVRQRITYTQQNDLQQTAVNIIAIDDNIIEGNEFAGIRIVIPPEFQDIVGIEGRGEYTIEIFDDDGNLFLQIILTHMFVALFRG